MKITTLWGIRVHEDSPELMVAWDEYSLDNNYEGYVEECEAAKASWGSDLESVRTLVVEVDDCAIDRAFAPVQTKGSVLE